MKRGKTHFLLLVGDDSSRTKTGCKGQEVEGTEGKETGWERGPGFGVYLTP